MQNHPSYPVLAAMLLKYPRSSGSLFQAYNDISLVQQWTQVQVLDLVSSARAAICGKNPQLPDDSLLHVVPCGLAESLSTSWLEHVFEDLGAPASIYLAITSDDSTIVYYKISSGIVKPPV